MYLFSCSYPVPCDLWIKIRLWKVLELGNWFSWFISFTDWFSIVWLCGGRESILIELILVTNKLYAKWFMLILSKHKWFI